MPSLLLAMSGPPAIDSEEAEQIHHPTYVTGLIHLRLLCRLQCYS